MCYLLHHVPKYKGGIWGSNPRHPEPQSGALPTELIPPYLKWSTPRGIRTPDLLLRRQLLYPAELLAQIATEESGAGDGNRTHVSSLEGWCSTIELHPHGHSLVSQKIIPQMMCGCQLFSYARMPEFLEIPERCFCCGDKVADSFFILALVLNDNAEFPESCRLERNYGQMFFTVLHD